MDSFGALFDDYWWLLFPLGFFVIAGWNSFMSYKRTQAKVELLKAYAKSGNAPPPELVAALNKSSDDGSQWHDKEDEGSGGGSTAFLVILFAGLSGVFTYVGYTGWLGDTTSMYFVAMILAVLAVAFLFGGLFGRKRRG